jgi:hypothetical protein
MGDGETAKQLLRRIADLEQEVAEVRRSISSRQDFDIQGNPNVIKAELGEQIVNQYTIVKIVHNDAGTNRYGKCIIYGGSSTDDDLADFVPGIALGVGNPGDIILVQIGGNGYARTTGANIAYGGDGQIVAGDFLTANTGELEKETGTETPYFRALESQHNDEDLLIVKFETIAGGDSQRMFPVKITSLFGGQTYFGDLYANGPEEEATEENITIRAIDDTAMTGILVPGIFYLGWRQNLATGTVPFFVYYIQPARWE